MELTSSHEIESMNYFLKVIGGRSKQALFRLYSNGLWKQITGEVFLSDIATMVNIFDNNKVSHDNIKFSCQYENIVAFMATLLLGKDYNFKNKLAPIAALDEFKKEYNGNTKIIKEILQKSTSLGKIIFENKEIKFSQLIEESVNLLKHPAIEKARPKHTGSRWLSFSQDNTEIEQICWIAALLENGVYGFPDYKQSWRENLRILRPTVILASNETVQYIAQSVQKIKESALLSWKIEKALRTLRIFKTPLMREAFEDLCTVVLNSSEVNAKDEEILTKIGLHVVRWKPQHLHT